MIRSRSAFAALAAGALLLGACGGSGSASQSDVEEDVREQLLEEGFVPGFGEDPIEVTEGEAGDVADCVADAMFDPQRFTKDERDAATGTADGDEPDPDLVLKVEALMNECYDEVTGGSSGSDESGDGETTTTEG